MAPSRIRIRSASRASKAAVSALGIVRLGRGRLRSFADQEGKRQSEEGSELRQRVLQKAGLAPGAARPLDGSSRIHSLPRTSLCGCSRLPGSGPPGGCDDVLERRARGTCEDRKRHGCRLRAYREVFTACPSRYCAPASARNPTLRTNRRHHRFGTSKRRRSAWAGSSMNGLRRPWIFAIASLRRRSSASGGSVRCQRSSSSPCRG